MRRSGKRDYSVNDRLRMGASLRAAREARGLLQRELASQLGVTVSMIAKWETAVSAVPLRRIGELERALGVSLGEFLRVSNSEVSAGAEMSPGGGNLADGRLLALPEVRAWWVESLLAHRDQPLPKLELLRARSLESFRRGSPEPGDIESRLSAGDIVGLLAGFFELYLRMGGELGPKSLTAA